MENHLDENNEIHISNEDIIHNEKLLSLVNEAAVLLLTIEPDQFENALTESMKKMGTCLDVDCVYIWHLNELDNESVYTLIHGWISPTQDSTKKFESIFNRNSIPRSSDWDDRLLSKQGYLADITNDFNEPLRTMLSATGVQSVMAFPVFFQGKYWGFVSFENRHSERLCSKKEASILQSGSLLLANAVERNESILQLNERLSQQQLMADISRRFITKEPMDNLIQDALARMGKFLNVNRVLIAIFEKDSEISRPTYFWFNDQKYAPTSGQKGFSSILRELFPISHDNNNDDSLNIYCDNALTYNNGKFKLFYEKAGLKSFICVPIYVKDELWGTMSLEDHNNFRKWSDSDSTLINSVASAISNAVVRDIIEKERVIALDKALRANNAKSDFLANMSHEIRTPMNAIIGMTAIGKSSESLEKKDYAFNKISNASTHLLGIINDILDMSKIEANKLELSPVNFEFEKMLQKVVNFISFRVDELNQKFYVNIDYNIPPVLIGDDQRLSQVITNLLSNAVKYTPDGGTIHLDTKLLSIDDDICRLQVSVKDTGIGINEEQKLRLFNSFEQAESGTSRKFGGTGLGLAISKRIVEMMGGEIWIESEPGQGSNFSFTVVLKKGTEVKKHILSEGVNWENIRIFAVDDDEEIRNFFTSLADNLGVSCDTAATGEEAVGLLTINPNYDIYFIDWKLPGMNGIDLAREIINKHSNNSIVILFSSTDWSIIEDDARAAGIDKFLPKPLFQSTIIDIINECLNSENTVGKEHSKKHEKYDNFSGHTILLAEDMDINREIIIALLEPINLTVDCAENGAQALKLFEDSPQKYDMIFMDLQMPEMDGYEATKRIRQLELPRAKEIPIVAMTANVFREDIEHCLEVGMNAHVGKPVNFNEILDVLKKYINI